MDTDATAGDALARLRLLQLTSPALPVGAFTYSQGLEWAVETGWINDSDTLADWLQGLIDDALAPFELPILARLYDACAGGEAGTVAHWARICLAGREGRELRAEERNRARALCSLLRDLGVVAADTWRDSLADCQAAPFALAAVHWGIARRDCLLGYAWGWLENQVAAAIKLVPLGQTDGQRVQLRLAACLPATVERALALGDDDIGASAPALAIASARHETQYTRLFRS
ncbi:MAG: urease accessory protein UreF [Chromatiaceae bacterium]|nr:urease accessory protein UreF [Gammaproteobacteria bacterium]MCP5300703.1 urease accessory protein UreF [Chromatiaceae bacterium]MCP5422775.1 urease accessory protein UreF [Chromatiaceae bacterium]